MNFIRRFLANSYGMDKLGYFTLATSIALTLSGSLLDIAFLILLGRVLLLYTFFRFISRNKNQRFKENQKFLVAYNKYLTKLNQAKNRIGDKKNNYFRCPRCKTYLSVPKGAGKVMIICRKCNHQFIKRSK